MSDYGEMCKDIRRHNQAKRRKEFNKNSGLIDGLMLEHEIKNNGHHVIVKHKGKVADYWPASDKYHIRKSGEYNHGMKKMIMELTL